VLKAKINEAVGLPGGKQKLQYDVSIQFNGIFYSHRQASHCAIILKTIKQSFGGYMVIIHLCIYLVSTIS